jgi:hypothetical protein
MHNGQAKPVKYSVRHMTPMNIRALFAALWLVFFSIANAGADTQGDPFSQAQKLLPSAALLCSGHVTGAPISSDRPGPHITWRAYALIESPEMTTTQFRTLLLAEPALSADGCSEWRNGTSPVKGVISVCASVVKGPWSACSVLPNGIQTIVVKSDMVGHN